MGANLANEIALEQLSEATVACKSSDDAKLWSTLFQRPYFRVATTADVTATELCGTLKNIVAIGAGLVDGTKTIDGSPLGNNTKAAIVRNGLVEMRRLTQKIAPETSGRFFGVSSFFTHSFSVLLHIAVDTFFESCGVADLITTCLGGRNRKVAEAYAKAGGSKSWTDLETELLGGQKLQGVLTSLEVQTILERQGWTNEFPLFSTIHAICTGRLPPQRIVDFWRWPKV